ncbi:MAG: cation:H+ antiporter [Actinomycetota bacterium]|nr:cation:H+ antiporter [Actinomycetota bacterium]
MTPTPGDDEIAIRPGRQRLNLGLALCLTVPGIVLRLGDMHANPATSAALFGLAIVGAAFMLSWAAEVAQLDISAGLAIAVLAFIAVLPEYAVDMVFAWKGGNAVEKFGPACHAPGSSGESPCSLALANMTGANRLLIGIGWSMVVFVAWYRWRQRGVRNTEVVLERSHSVELAFLTVACAYSLTLPLKRSITLVDAVVLVGLFVLYTIRISKAPAEEPHLVGPAAYLGTFPTPRRRTSVILLFLFAAGVILLCAEHFAEALVETGARFGVSEFLLVQWLAPLASEAPELLVAGLYAWRLNTNAGLGTLVSSKVNQWTLLVGTLPIVFALASGGTHGLPIIARQREELLLTAAQSVFAVAVLSSLSISVKEALALFSLFWAQFLVGAVVPQSAHGVELVGVSVLYLVLAVGIIVRNRQAVPRLLRDGLRTPYAELTSEP